MTAETEFIDFAVTQEVLRFGEFRTKAGRVSPYFFNAGLFRTGAALDRLAQFYAKAIVASGIVINGLFGPAYKGIPLVAAVAIALSRAGIDLPFSYNRKEAKEHGEGGTIVGTPLAGRILIVDDVITAGTSVREAVDLIRAAGALPCGVVVALDRMERGSGELSAVQEVERAYAMSVIAIATVDDLLAYLRGSPQWRENEAAVADYRREYGVARVC